MKKNFFSFAMGVSIGYLLVQGFAYLNQNVLWTLFYR